MSDSEDSTVTYTAVSSPFGGLSEIGSSRVDGPPVMPEDPYAYVVASFQALPFPDYVPGPEYPPSPDFVPELVYPEFMPPKDEVLPTEEQPLPAALSPTADSLGYVPELDPDEDPEEDDNEEPKEDHILPTEEMKTMMRMIVALPAVDQAPSAEETEPFKTDEFAATPAPHPAYRITAIRDDPPTPFWFEAEVSRLLAIPTPPPSPLSSCPIHPLGYRAVMIRLRAKAPSTSHSLPLPPPIILSHTRSDAPSSGTPPLLPIPLPTSSPPLHLLSTDRRADRLEVTLPPRKRADYGFVATINKEIMRDLERDVGYGITDTWDEMLVDMPGAPVNDDTKLG
ncbi:hypothetical protein Tco_1528185 [Tanacetum coccineum]